MKISKRILCALLAFVMLFSVCSTGFTASAGTLSLLLKPIDMEPIERPRVEFYCTEVTRVASSANSLELGTNIVKATPSGVPEFDGAYSSQLYAGETPAATRITFKSSTTGISITKITSSNSTVSFSPIVYEPPGTYYIDIAGGNANPGDAITFTVDYTWTDGKTYQEKCVTYVENIVTGGSYVTMEYTWKPYHGNSSWYRGMASASTRLLGEGVYYEQPVNMSLVSYGIYNVANGAIQENPAAGYDTAIYQISQDDSAAFFDDPRDDRRYSAYVPQTPIAHVYIDKARTTNLSDINLRIDANVGGESSDKHSNEWTQATALIDSYVYTGLISEDPGTYTNDEAAATALGYTLPAQLDRGCMQPAEDLHGEIAINTITKGGNVYEHLITSNLRGGIENFTDGASYTIINKYYRYFRASAAHVTITPYVPVQMVFHIVDKGDLAEAIDYVMNSDPESPYMKVSQKGTNPQKWFYKSGFDTFQTAYTNAVRVYNSPKSTQDEIDAATTALKTGYRSLSLKGADYTELDEWVEKAEQLLEKEDCYPSVEVDLVREALDMVESGYSILYQPAVDSMVENIEIAINNARPYDGDYTKVRDAVSKYSALNGIDYTTSSWRALKDAVAAVEYGLDATYQEQIDGYADAILQAIDNLEIYGASFDNLIATLNEARAIDRTLYMNGVLLVSPMNAAQAAIDDNAESTWPVSRQSEVDTLEQNLRSKINGLIYKAADKTALDAAINMPIGGNEIYYNQTLLEEYKALRDEAVIMNEDQTLNRSNQAEIDSMTLSLTEKYELLLASYDLPVDVSALVSAIEKANALDPEDFIEDEMWAEFDAALQSGQTLLDSQLTEDSGPEVAAAAERIEAAILSLNAKEADLSKVYELSGKLVALKSGKTDVTTYIGGVLSDEKMPKYDLDKVAELENKIADFLGAKDVYYTTDRAEIEAFTLQLGAEIEALETVIYYEYLNHAMTEFESVNPDECEAESYAVYKAAYDEAAALADDASQAEINSALKNLVNSKGDIVISAYFKAAQDSTTVIDKENGFIYGLEEGIEDLEAFVSYDGGVIEYIPTALGYGTGTIVNFVVNGEIKETYTIVIFGDVNGDGVVDTTDYAVLSFVVNGEMEFAEGSAMLMAGDLFADGVIDTMDLIPHSSYTNGETNLSQVPVV